MPTKATELIKKKIADRKTMTAAIKADPLKNATEVSFEKQIIAEAENHEATKGTLWDETDEKGIYVALKNIIIKAATACYGFREQYWAAEAEAYVDEGEKFPHHFIVIGER